VDLPYYIELDRNSDGKTNGLKKEVVNYDINSNEEDDKNGTNGTQKLVVIGFGDINPDDTITELPNSLYKVEVTYVDNKQCDIEHGNNNEITDGMLCAGGDGYDSSFGDSGGPLIKQQQQQDIDEAVNDDAIDADTDILIGLVSWGRTMNEPGVYVRISYYYTWIRSIVCDQYLDDAPFYFECQTPPPTKEPTTNPPRIFDGFKAPTSKEPTTTKVPTKEPTNPPLILDGFIINNNNNNGATETTTTTTTKTTEVPTNPYLIPDGFKQSYYNTLISNKSNP
jgi:secreted trypsin-like serine protease